VHELVKEFTERQEEMVSFLAHLVELESPSVDKAAVDRLGDFLACRLERAGFHVRVVGQKEHGNHIVATWQQEEPSLLMLCHMDTVWPVGEVKRRPFRVEGNRAYGPGVFDMKGGIVQAIFALEAARRRGLCSSTVKILFNSDEEIGSPSSRSLIEDLARSAKAVLVLEPSVPPQGALKTFRKGVGMFRIKVVGRAAHAGADPDKGVNAIEELARQIIKLHRLTDPETGTTVNVGVVRGGSRSNVVPAEAWAEVDLRVSSKAEAERVIPLIKGLLPELPGATVEVEGGLNRPPMERTESIVALFRHAQRVARELGFELEEAGSGGASDGNFTAALGVPTLDGLGAVGAGGHAVDEYLLLNFMPERTALLTRLLETL